MRSMFLWSIKELGVKPTLDVMVIDFCKWFVGAKRIRLYYPRTADSTKKYNQRTGH